MKCYDLLMDEMEKLIQDKYQHSETKQAMDDLESRINERIDKSDKENRRIVRFSNVIAILGALFAFISAVATVVSLLR